MEEPNDASIQRYVKVYPKGSVIAQEGDVSDSFVVLIEGSVGIFKGARRIAEVSQPGAYLGEMSYLLDSRRTATMRAVTPVRAYVFPGRSLYQLVESSPAAAIALLKSLANRLRTTTGQFAVLNRAALEGEAAEGTGAPTQRDVHRGIQHLDELIFMLRTVRSVRPEPWLDELIQYVRQNPLATGTRYRVPDMQALQQVVLSAHESDTPMIDFKVLCEKLKGSDD